MSRDFTKAQQSVAGESTNASSVGNATLLLLAVQLGLVLYTIYKFQIEHEHSLPLIGPSIFIGFIVNHFLSARHRLPFLFVLFAVTIGLLLGPALALCTVVIGLGILGLCHLPLPFAVRVTCVVFAGAFLAAIRTGWIFPFLAPVVPIVASMFLFRVILYLYELKQGSVTAGGWQRICYFFLLPNISLPLFPIVDFKTFLRTYYDEDPFVIYQRGIRRMVRGITQLLLYRLVYMFLLRPPYEVTDFPSLLLYLFASYMLVLKIAGLAHLAVGVLCLFGFNLPPVFKNYFLASSFADLWRRVNIYWKDFMMKVVYYPFFFRLRKSGTTLATVMSLLLSFLITWLLHSYQFFWFVGRFSLSANDAIFWSFFGVMVAVNSVMEMNRPKRKSLGAYAWNFQKAAVRSFKIICFFSWMCFVWSFWDSASLGEWFSVLSAARAISAGQLIVFVLSMAAAVVLGAFLQKPLSRIGSFSALGKTRNYRAAYAVIAFLSLLLVVRMYRFYVPTNSVFFTTVRAIQQPRLNERDSENRERGYYQPMFENTQLTSDFFTVGKLKPVDWKDIFETSASRWIDDLLLLELVPSQRIDFKTGVLTTNRWGMRDRDYEKEKAPGVYRFALVGGSIEMGSGVRDTATFENIVENQFNKNDGNPPNKSVEILNFSVGGYDPVRFVRVCETKVFPFHPDAVMIVTHTGDGKRTVDRFVDIVNRKVDLEYDYLKALVQKSGVQPGMDRTEMKKRLLPYSTELLRWAYESIARKCIENHAVPVWVFLPVPTRMDPEGQLLRLKEIAESQGYVIMDLSGAYSGQNYRSLQIVPWDEHPNEIGHEKIAADLYSKIVEKKAELHLKTQ